MSSCNLTIGISLRYLDNLPSNCPAIERKKSLELEIVKVVGLAISMATTIIL